MIILNTVHTNTTSIEKALLAVVEHSRVAIDKDRVKSVAKIANCDMSVALNLLRLTPKQGSRMPSEDSNNKDLSDSNLFHRLGKILYNKRRHCVTEGRT